MLIIGAGGLAREVLEVYLEAHPGEEIYFYDDVNPDLTCVYDTYPVLKRKEDVSALFQKFPSFLLGVGDPRHREDLLRRFSELGGTAETLVAPTAVIGKHEVRLGEGCYVSHGTIITTHVTIGKGCLLNLHCTVGHDCEIGDFTVLSPGVHVSGRCRIGAGTNIGTGAVILPGITVGDRVVIGAGAVVTKDIPSNTTATGVPARVTHSNYAE